MKKMKKPALVVLHDLLAEHGMDMSEIDALLSRFLEEEAEDYLDFVAKQKKAKKVSKKKQVKKPTTKKKSKK